MTCYYVSLDVQSLLIVGENEWGELNSSRGSFRESRYALVPPGTCSCCPLLSNGVDLGLSPLLSLLLSCFWCMRNRRASDYLQDKGVVVCQVVSLLFASQIILLYRVYWQAIGEDDPDWWLLIAWGMNEAMSTIRQFLGHLCCSYIFYFSNL